MYLQTSDGVPISAHHDPGAADLAIVVAHGFTGSWRRPALRRAAEAFGAYGGVVSFDFRGHGQSAGLSTCGRP
jgi:predicted alpha/beta-fold hydrolase